MLINIACCFDCADVGMNLANDAEHHSVVWILLVAFTQCDSTTQHTAPMQRLHWLLELMGHASNVAHGKTQLAPNRSIAKVIVVIIIIKTCNAQVSTLLGVQGAVKTKNKRKQTQLSPFKLVLENL